MKIPVRLVLTIFVSLVVCLALLTKGDVKTTLKFLGLEFSLETKDKAAVTSKVMDTPPQPIRK